MLKKALLVILSLVGMLISPISLMTTSAHAAATQSRVYPAKIDGYAAPNPATLAIRFHVYNDGTQPISPSCTIKAQDGSGAYHGFDIFNLKPMPAGTTINTLGNITITNQGAGFVTQVTITCAAQTLDTATISGYVSVIRVDPPTTDGFAGHDASGWFWGGIPIVSGVTDNSQLKCTVRALDSLGHVLTSYTFNGQVYQGGVSGPGTQNTTSAIGAKIKTASASCERGIGDISSPVAGPNPSKSATPQAFTAQQWYPDGYEEDSPGFAWKWTDNTVNCFSDKTNACWTGQLIVKGGCPHGAILKVGLYPDKTKKEVATFTQKYFANFLPMTGTILSMNNKANASGPNGQIDSVACMTAAQGGTNPIPLKNVPINTTYNNVASPKGDVPLGNDFYVGTTVIKCSAKGYELCFTLDVLNKVFCSKGYTFSGYFIQNNAKQGWLPISGDAGRDKVSPGATGGTHIVTEFDFRLTDLEDKSGLSQAAIEATPRGIWHLASEGVLPSMFSRN
jgi:hypothetical protein